jgi:hypothetical protein
MVFRTASLWLAHDHERAGRARSGRDSSLASHLSPQWLRRLISTMRSPSKTCLSSWFTP